MSDETRPVVVVDASAALAVIRREPAADQIHGIVVRSASAADRLVVPDGFWVELANVLVRRYAASAEKIVESFRELDDLGIESVRIDRVLVLASIDVQRRYGLSAYDAVYLALAEAENGRLLTLDRRLAASAGSRAVRVGGIDPTRLAEDRAPYDSEPVDWARFGPYLARLRADARADAR